jgi:proteasome lid subunit RPN8/RPN11
LHGFFVGSNHPVLLEYLTSSFGNMWKIKRTVLESIVQAAKNTFPDEFIAFLGGELKKKEVTELIILPSQSGTEAAIIRSDLLPLNVKSVGSVHSHPGHSNFPSSADKKLFSQQGEIHLIICLPFSAQTIRAFDRGGKTIPFEGKE